MMFATTSGVMGFLKAGQVRPLVVTMLKRSASLPDVPTMDESALPGFEATTWHGFVAPVGTPPTVIDTLHRAMLEVLKDLDVQQKLAALGVDIAPGSPDEFAAYIKAEIPKWAAVIKASGAKVE
jgi:tripartite-type tricarboxylate transporter receptor subunit TctC